MKTAIFLPPLTQVSGGFAVLLRIGEHLAHLGHDVCVVPREPIDIPSHLPCILWNDLQLDHNTLWLVPEGWPTALLPGLTAQARCVLYVQNWAYMLSNLPEGAHWERLPVRFLAVSDPVRWFVREMLGLETPVLRPGIDIQLFYPPQRNPAAPVRGPIRIAWMPRKNKALARQIRDATQARMMRLHPHSALEWIEIHNRTQAEVAEIMRESHIFLSTGFPEGCPLPPLEAMASGCIVVGFAGLGGWDYMRQALPEAHFALQPWCPMRTVPWGGNSIIVADADVPGAALALDAACQLLRKGGPPLGAVRQQALATASHYSLDAQRSAVAELWKSFY